MQEAGRWGARKARGENENGDACRVAKARAVHVSAPDGPDLAEKKNLGAGGVQEGTNSISFPGRGYWPTSVPSYREGARQLLPKPK